MNPVAAREVSTAPQVVPPSLRAELSDCKWLRNQVGEAGADVFRVVRPNGQPLYLKHARGNAAAMVHDEASRLHWLTQHSQMAPLALPALIHFECGQDEAWMLTTAMPGRTAFEWLEDTPQRATHIVQAITQHLKLLHATPIQSCPFAAGPDIRMALAENRLKAGLVDAEDFDEARAGSTAEDVWQSLRTLRARIDFGAVLTHGDYSLDNILLDEFGQVTGLIDVGRLGSADPYQDLSILSNCLEEFGAALQRQMWATYGIKEPDAERLEFHLCLDEMF